MTIQTFKFRGQLIGTATRRQVFIHASLATPMGKAFFCPICAELWLIAQVEGQTTQVDTKLCERHKPGEVYGTWSSGKLFGTEIAGSIWSSYDSDWNAALPDLLIKREFELHLQQHEGELNDNT